MPHAAESTYLSHTVSGSAPHAARAGRWREHEKRADTPKGCRLPSRKSFLDGGPFADYRESVSTDGEPLDALD